MAIDFPNSPSINDTYTVDSRTWVWTGTAWRIVTASVGPTGPTGPAGYEGSDGPTGPAGQDGRFFTGATPPMTPAPEEGDAWYNSDSGRLYVYYDSYWVEASAPIAGPTGPAGADGTIGVDGATGPTGPSGDLTRTIRTVSTSTTLLATDENQMIRFTGTSPQTLTIPDVLTPGSSVTVIQDNSGLVSFASSGSVNLLSPTGYFDSLGQNSVITVLCVDSDEYRITGDVVSVIPFTATGGTISTAGGYKIHTFSSSGSFEVTSSPPQFDVEYLVVGAGGAGGDFFSGGGYNAAGGGGGAGGVLFGNYQPSVGVYPIAIGAAGFSTATSNSSGGYSTSGNPTSAFGLTALGGGRGGAGNSSGSANAYVAATGASGGGGVRPDASASYANGAAGTSGQGNSGGSYGSGTDGDAAGGGGYSSAGSNSGTGNGNGGDGYVSAISGVSVAYAAGGGGGKGLSGSWTGLGGSSGAGGNGQARSDTGKGGNATTPGSGGGGAGSANSSGVFKPGGNGANGVVIIRYPI